MAEKATIITGTISVHPRGFGFVEPASTDIYSQDIFIPKTRINTAVEGDTVKVAVNPKIPEKGPEGKVLTVLNRARKTIAGPISETNSDGSAWLYSPLLGSDRLVYIKPSEHRFHHGDRIVAEVQDWGDRDTSPTAEFSKDLGNIDDPSCDVNASIAAYDLRAEFPEEVLKEVEKLATRVAKTAKREDFRNTTCITIDPTTAKDFDDALSLTRDDKGNYHLGVHIADVAHYVKEGSALDQEASRRCNSTYFPGFCLPMLPGKLSEGLCSLKPKVNRYTASVLMTFNTQGDLVDYRICRSIIKSAKRFTYRDAKRVLDGKASSPHSHLLQQLVELCHLLKHKRSERGCLEFCLPEARIIVDDEGVPQKMEQIQYDITHQLVEEFMLKANEVIATHLSKQGKDLAYRIHERPQEQHTSDFCQLARNYGYNLPPSPTPQDLQNFFDEIGDTTNGRQLSLFFIKGLPMAYYAADNIGHYGLELEYYCHFTSPIRRYVDLTIQRILFSESALNKEELDKIAQKSSTQERLSAKAEYSTILLKKLRYIKQLPHKQQYQAIITKAGNMGIVFEIQEIMLEGFIPIFKLSDDYYVYNESSQKLQGTYSQQSYSLGDRITVMLGYVDLIALEARWHLIGEDSKPKKRRRKGRKKRKK
ncbi:MAG: ribonuclease R family protein [Chlamydiota bacterium]